MSRPTIRPVRTGNDRERFIKLLWKIYEGNPYWVPPLIVDRRRLMDKAKNPFYQHADAEFFLAERNGELVGRIAAIVNHNHNKEHGENIGFFGFFESLDDQNVAEALFDAAKEYLKSKGVTAMRGPANPSVNDEYGLLVDGFDLSPVLLMPYNPPYYVKLIERYGLTKAMDLYAYLLSQDTVYSDRLERANEIVKRRNRLTIRSLDMKNFNRDVAIVEELYNAAWAKNWGAVPMTEAEIDALAKDLKPIVVPELVIFAEAKGKPIGFALTLPDINIALKYNKKGRLIPGLIRLFLHKKEINLVRIIVLGVLPEYLNTGAAGVLFYETATRAQKLGYQYGEAGWVLEDNIRMVNAAEGLNGKVTKRYRIYEMPIS
ncbi:MAG: GNAT family N-acetyltransferase [Bacteroidota bacterium]